VASRRGLERLSMFESTRNRLGRIPVGWRVVGGLVVMFSALELYLVTQSSVGQTEPQAISSMIHGASMVQNALQGPEAILPAG
jgi:hypothetical protein